MDRRGGRRRESVQSDNEGRCRWMSNQRCNPQVTSQDDAREEDDWKTVLSCGEGSAGNATHSSTAAITTRNNAVSVAFVKLRVSTGQHDLEEQEQERGGEITDWTYISRSFVRLDFCANRRKRFLKYSFPWSTLCGSPS